MYPSAICSCVGAPSWLGVRSRLRSTSGVGGSSSLLEVERLRAEASEAEMAAQREAAAAQAKATAAAEASETDMIGGGHTASSPRRGLEAPGEALSTEQRAMERQRADYASQAAKPSAALKKLRSGQIAKNSTTPNCDVCGKTIYPTERCNVNGFQMHIRPCAQCGRVTRDGVRCSNAAQRVVSDGGVPLPLCDVHYKQRATEVGEHAPPPRALRESKANIESLQDETKGLTLVAKTKAAEPTSEGR